MTKLKIGARLRELREAKGVSQSEVARDTSILQKSISSYENNHSFPPIDILTKIANYFDVSLDYIVFGYDLVEKYNEKIKNYKFFKYLRVIEKVDIEYQKAIEMILKAVVISNKENEEVKKLLEKEKILNFF